MSVDAQARPSAWRPPVEAVMTAPLIKRGDAAALRASTKMRETPATLTVPKDSNLSSSVEEADHRAASLLCATAS